ncbi:MAG: ATP-binding protein [Nocardioides sp.]
MADPRGGRRVVHSLRFRLTVLATALVALVLAATAAALLAVQHRQLTARLDASLAQRADLLTTELAAAVPEEPLATNDPDRAIQVVDPEGRVLAASENLTGEPALSLPTDWTHEEVVRTRDDLPITTDDYRVLSRWVETARGPAALLVIENNDDLNDTVETLTQTLAVVVPLVAAVLAGLVWWLTGRSLRPVETIRAQVDEITAAEPGHRVQVPDRDDEIGRLAVTMNTMLGRLDEAAERQRRFVADAAHELRTPLTRIRAAADLAVAHPGRVDLDNATEAIVREAAGMQQLIDDLLYLARSDADELEHDGVEVDLDDVVLAQVREERSTSGRTIDASGVSAVAVRGSARALGRAVRNLLANATQHAATTVRVSLVDVGDSAELVVADDGPGVPAVDREHIFERFARVDAARSREGGGTGLGLAITRDIVTRHGGTVRYDGEGPGARFVVRLPVVRE